MPHTLAALARGETTERPAMDVVAETAALTREHRAAVDAELGPVLGQLGDRATRARARAAGYCLQPTSLVQRISRAQSERCVTIRPAPDAMTYVTALLPLAQGVALYAALRKHAESLRGTGGCRDESGRARGLGQLMADTLVQRVTGLADPETIPVEVQLVMTDRTMLGLEQEPVMLRASHAAVGPDVGLLPAWLGRRLVRSADKAWIRRLWSTPHQGELINADTRRRVFNGPRRDLIVARDQVCRTPWCEAPIRHADHVRAWADGGPTTTGNGQGLCERCNYLLNNPGWTRDRAPDTTDIDLTTPTKHTYSSRPPPAPGRTHTPVEQRLRDQLIAHALAA